MSGLRREGLRSLRKKRFAASKKVGAVRGDRDRPLFSKSSRPRVTPRKGGVGENVKKNRIYPTSKVFVRPLRRWKLRGSRRCGPSLREGGPDA